VPNQADEGVKSFGSLEADVTVRLGVRVTPNHGPDVRVAVGGIDVEVGWGVCATGFNIAVTTLAASGVPSSVVT